MNNINFSDPATYAKAIGGALAAALVALLAKYDIVLSDDLNAAVQLVLASAVGFVVVLLTRKNKEV